MPRASKSSRSISTGSSPRPRRVAQLLEFVGVELAGDALGLPGAADAHRVDGPGAGHRVAVDGAPADDRDRALRLLAVELLGALVPLDDIAQAFGLALGFGLAHDVAVVVDDDRHDEGHLVLRHAERGEALGGALPLAEEGVLGVEALVLRVLLGHLVVRGLLIGGLVGLLAVLLSGVLFGLVFPGLFIGFDEPGVLDFAVQGDRDELAGVRVDKGRAHVVVHRARELTVGGVEEEIALAAEGRARVAEEPAGELVLLAGLGVVEPDAAVQRVVGRRAPR
jgi:hypothetical protein